MTEVESDCVRMNRKCKCGVHLHRLLGLRRATDQMKIKRRFNEDLMKSGPVTKAPRVPPQSPL